MSHGITFLPVIGKDSEKSPDYKIVVLGTAYEIGAGWNQTSKSTDKPFIKVKLDDPFLPFTLWGALTANDGGEYALFWSRPKTSSVSKNID